MSALVKFRTIGGVPDGRIRLANSSICRTLSIGNSWTKIRIGIRACFEDPISTLPGETPLLIGVCSGTSNPFDNGSATTTNFVGAFHGYPTVGGWNRLTSGADVGFDPSFIYAATRVGTTTTTSASSISNASGSSGLPAKSDFSKSGMILVDITKGAPSYSVNVFTGSYTAAHVTRDVFISTAFVEAAVLTGFAFRTSRTITASEVAGNLDTLNIAWSRYTPVLEISDVAVVRFA